MTTVDGFYDASSGDRTYDSQEFSDWIKMTRTNGVVIGYNNSMTVGPNSPVGMSVVVATGAAFAQGRFIEVTAAHTLTITAADVTNPRIDRVIVRADESAGVRSTSLVVLAGTPAGSPVAPSLTQTATIWEISLAQVSVIANETEITSAEITDERNDEAVCGHSFLTDVVESARVRRTSDEAVVASTPEVLTWQTVDWDSNEMVDLTANNTRITIRRTGLYLIQISLTISSISQQTVNIVKNGTTDIITFIWDEAATTNGLQNQSQTASLAEGDYLEFELTTNDNVNVVAGTNPDKPIFTVTFLGRIA